MRSADEVPVHHLVADSGAFIKRAPLQDLGAVIYTVSDVIDELKCEKSKHLLETIPYEITIREPSKQSLRIVSECSKKTGDYSALSAVDLKILALTHDLHVQVCGADKLNYECKKVPSKETNPENGIGKDDNDKDKNKDDKDDDDKEPEVVKKYDSLAGFYNPPPKEQKNNTEDDRPKSTDNGSNDNDNADDGGSDKGSDNGNDNESDESSDNEGWLDERNIDENLLEMGAVAVPDKDMKVACITTDFAIQNVLLHVGLALLSVDGYRIRRLNSYILRCRSCFATTSQMDRRFCAKCGNDSLHRVAVTVDEDGTMLMHINWQRLTSKRGLQYSLPAPKGGKHATDPQLFEDQRIPQNRTARSRIDPLQRSPFTMHDVTSRSAMLGIRDRGGHVGVKRNPNAPARGRKRGGKRR